MTPTFTALLYKRYILRVRSHLTTTVILQFRQASAMAPPDIGNPTPVAAATLPDYLTDPSAVLKDEASWRYGRAPDYSNTRSVYEKSKLIDHGPICSLLEPYMFPHTVRVAAKHIVSNGHVLLTV